MKVISFANKNHGGLVNLQHSMQPGWEHIIIGKGVVWKGWVTRMQTIVDFMKTLPTDEICVLCDAFDVMCLRGSEGFDVDFDTFQKDIVVSAEAVCGPGNCHFPERWWQVHELKRDIQDRYCNAGLIAGKSVALKEMFEWILEQQYTDDQKGVGNFMDAFESKIHLDYEHRLFFNDGYAKSDYTMLDNRELRLNASEVVIKPYFIHFPGMNVIHSISLLHFFSTQNMFRSGENYDVIGEKINGAQHIQQTLPNKDVYVPTMWAERAVFITLLFALIALCVYWSR
jgi:hypothetical protein